MAKMTPQQIAVAAAKRRAAIAARKANGGMTVRQMRAAARAAKAQGTTTTTNHTTTNHTTTNHQASAPKPTAAPSAASFGSKAYSAPAPTYRDAKVVALSSLESAFVLKLKESGITDDARAAYDKYKKLKALALAPTLNVFTQNEADAALRQAVIALVKFAF